jgi:3-oxoacyl-[acyl-carrier protein] reductase
VETGLAGKGVLVTGASGGIGAACVAAFRAEGARVAAHYHRGRDRAEATGADVVVSGDLRDEIEVERVFAEVRSGLGGIDVCAAVAGVWPSEDVPVWELPLDRWENTLRANLTTMFLTTRAFLREVARNGHGSLVMIASTAGLVGEAGHADYATAKSAIAQGLLLSLKNEIVQVAPFARVNVVAPGWTVSPMTESELTDEAIARVTATMALRKVATAEDVARSIAFLCSPLAAGHVTGQVITVAGGMEGRLLR